MHHVLILELRIGSVVVDNRKKRSFVAEETDDVVVCRRSNTFDLSLQSVFFQDHHLVLKNVSIVLLE